MSDWMTRALCDADDTAMFFSDDPVRRSSAKALCASCPVIGECRQYALDRPQLKGMWGGLTDSERNAVRASTPNRAPRWRDGSTGPRHAGPRAAGVL